MFRSVLLVSLLFPGLAFAGFKASSFKKESKRGENFWNATSALDGRLESCWMVDPEEKNEGSWIELDIPSSSVDKIAMVIGWDQDENHFYDYARVKRARVIVYDQGDGGDPKQVMEHTVSFEDKRGWQIVDVPDTRVGGEVLGGKVRLIVTEVYPGKDFPALAVSELRVHLKEFPAETLMFGGPDSSGPSILAGAAAEKGKAVSERDQLIDGNPKTVFYVPIGETVHIKAPGYGVASVGIQAPANGPRAKTLKLMANDIEVTRVLEDKHELQWVLLPVVVGYTGSAWGTVQVTVVDAYNADSSGVVGVAELKMNAATIEDF